MWFFEHPEKTVATYRAFLLLLMFYVGSFLVLRMTDRLPPRPEILRDNIVAPTWQTFYLPCYLVENLAGLLRGAEIPSASPEHPHDE